MDRSVLPVGARIKRSASVVVALLVLVLLLALGASASADPLGQVTEFSTGITANSHPLGITAGADGNLWFTEYESNRIARISTTGAVTEFSSEGIRRPSQITAGPDGNLWFTLAQNKGIGRITTTGAVTDFPGIISASGTLGIAAGPGGNLWFTQYPGIGRMTPTGTVTEFSPGFGVIADTIAAGPDGNLWFTGRTEALPDNPLIGRITPTGTVTVFSEGISAESVLDSITAGPDGNMWFTENRGNRIGRITPTGTVTEFSAGISAESGPAGITAGPDGNLWFTEERGNRIGRITPTGNVTEFSTGITPESYPVGITAGPDGNVWFTERAGNRIGRIDTAGAPPPPPGLPIPPNPSTPITVPLPCQGPASAGNVFVQGIEVTQAVQTIQFPDTGEGCYRSPLDSQSHPGSLYPSGAWRNADGTARYVELVQGRSIVVRVFAATYGLSPTAPVAARLYIFRNGRRITQMPLEPDARRRALSHGLPFDVPLLFDVPYYTERIDPAGAYEFDIPGSWAYGNLTLVAQLNPADAPPALPECPGCAVDDVFTLAHITFKKTRSVRIHPTEIGLTGAPVAGFPSPPAVFSKEPLVLPVADGQLSVPSQYQSVLNLNLVGGEPAPPKDLSLALYGVELSCCFNSGFPALSANPIDYYVGVDPSFPGQTQDGIPVSVVNPARPLTSVAHELGHGFGLHHAGTDCPNQYSPFVPPPTQDGEPWPLDDEGFLQGVGVDPAQITPDGYYRVVASSNPLGEFAPLNEQLYDLMSYCVGYLGSSTNWEAGSWISPINWNRLVDALASGAVAAKLASLHSPARRLGVAHAATAGSFALRVLAQVTQTDATIGFVEPSRAAAPSGSFSSPYHLIARDGSGRVLADVGMQVQEGHTYMGPSFTLLSAAVPAAGAQSIEITNSGKVVAQRTRSTHRPRVQILAPKPGATVGRCHRSPRCSVWVRWRTSSGSRSMLAFVDYSSDRSRHWRTIYLGPDSGSVALSAALFSHARSARIRIRVNDGFNETSATSGGFAATGHSPTVAITSPTAGEHVASNASLYLSGSAQDDSGRSLSGTRLRWYIGPKLVGTGTEIITTKKLASGTVRVRLVARDSQGRRTSAAVVIHTFASR